MNHGSLFSGGGGFDLAAQWMGWNNVFHCENNPFGQKILKHYWPNAKSYTDIKSTDFTIWNGKIDIITGGFPCQPFSNAGKREGTGDDRFLWPEMCRAIRESKPTWVVAENVPGILTIEQGMVFEQVCLDLENEGYTIQAFNIPAVATDKDHRRERVWIVAYNERFVRSGRGKQQPEGKYKQEQSFFQSSEYASQNTERNGWTNIGDKEETSIWEQRNSIPGNGERLFQKSTHTEPKSIRERSGPDCERSNDQSGEQLVGAKQRSDSNNLSTNAYTYCNSDEPCKVTGNNSKMCGLQTEKCESEDGASIPSRNVGERETWLEAATRLCVVDDGLPGRLDGITVPKWRTESLKMAGNAICPQVALQIFKAINSTL